MTAPCDYKELSRTELSGRDHPLHNPFESCLAKTRAAGITHEGL